MIYRIIDFGVLVSENILTGGLETMDFAGGVIAIFGGVIGIFIGLLTIGEKLDRSSNTPASNYSSLTHPQPSYNVTTHQITYINNVYVYVNYGNGQYYLQNIYSRRSLYPQHSNNQRSLADEIRAIMNRPY